MRCGWPPQAREWALACSRHSRSSARSDLLLGSIGRWRGYRMQWEDTAMQTATLEEVQTHLPSLLATLKPGEELMIIHENRPIARLILESPPSRKPRQPGSAIGQLIILQEDDEHLKDFQEYMP